MADSTPDDTPSTPQINLSDMQNVLRIIDVAAERGAFRGNELTTVGGVRDKLAAFLEATLPKDSEPNAEAETTAEAA